MSRKGIKINTRKAASLQNRKERELELKEYTCKEQDLPILEVLKKLHTFHLIPKCYLTTMFDDGKALERLQDLKDRGFLNFEEREDDIVSITIYKSKISKAIYNYENTKKIG